MNISHRRGRRVFEACPLSFGRPREPAKTLRSFWLRLSSQSTRRAGLHSELCGLRLEQKPCEAPFGRLLRPLARGWGESLCVLCVEKPSQPKHVYIVAFIFHFSFFTFHFSLFTFHYLASPKIIATFVAQR